MDMSRLPCWELDCLWSLLWEELRGDGWGWGMGWSWRLPGRRFGRVVQSASRLESEGPYAGYQSFSPVCSFCFLLDCTHRLPTAPWGIALLLPQLQSVHISLN